MRMDDPEQRVDEMTAEGLRIMREAIDLYRPVQIVAAYSGGDDSIVPTHFVRSTYPDSVVVNISTLVSLAPARRHIGETCERQKWPLAIYEATACGRPNTYPASEWRDGATAYEERVLNYGFCGPAKHGIMYANLKERPLRRMVAEFKRGKPRSACVLIVSGIRHDESARRAGYRSPVTKVGGQIWVNPFYYRTAADFEAYRQEFGLPRNPVKKQCGISGDCCCGAFGKPAIERPAYAAIDPAFNQYLDALQTRVQERFPWGWGERPPESWMDAKRGQSFLFQDEGPLFKPMCVGCNNGRR
jgi:3'-phosphoadenosine 5'-phosphosulfate sulfotransferase (PAPS reductase)/FAD synthetase